MDKKIETGPERAAASGSDPKAGALTSGPRTRPHMTYSLLDRLYAGSAAAEVESYIRALYREPLLAFRWHDGSGTDARVVLTCPTDRHGVRGIVTIRAARLSDALRSWEAVSNPWSEAESGTPECPGQVTWESRP